MKLVPHTPPVFQSQREHEDKVGQPAWGRCDVEGTGGEKGPWGCHILAALPASGLFGKS